MRKIIVLAYFVFLGSVYAAPPLAPSSIDLYCDTMTTAASETRERLASKPISKEKRMKVVELEAEMLKLCKSAPATGEAKLLSKMTAQEISSLSCLAMAEGITLAYITDQEPYSKLKERREFSGNACISNSKAFLNDIYKHGPDYVMARKY